MDTGNTIGILKAFTAFLSGHQKKLFYSPFSFFAAISGKHTTFAIVARQERICHCRFAQRFAAFFSRMSLDNVGTQFADTRTTDCISVRPAVTVLGCK